MLAEFDFDVIRRSWSYLIFDGLSFTLQLTLLSCIGGVLLGTLLAVLRVTGNPVLSWLVAQYVNLFRSIPLILLIFWFYFLVPYVGQWVTGSARPMEVGGFASALITFILFEAAYYSEIIRSGIQSISKPQVNAGFALGFNGSQVMRYVVLPQAFRKTLPILLSQTIVLFQNTSLVYVLALTDFLGAASKVALRDGRIVEMYTFVAVVYFALSFSASLLVKRMQSRHAKAS